ncbi:uncharacterized protein [Typha angustifolia]|uniref:uncharacterized protein n=1 Tax=Typha angustifolia TaxID=59011 RepID=UPI003C2D3E24
MEEPLSSGLGSRVDAVAGGGAVDYADIFGGLTSSSCTVPVLEISPPVDAVVPGFDYMEIFGGGFDGGGFAAFYEELVAESRRLEEGESSCGRISEETFPYHKATEASELPYEVLGGNTTACSEADQISSTSFLSNKGLYLHGVEYHKKEPVSEVNGIDWKGQAAEIHAIPKQVSEANGCSLPNLECNNPSDLPSNDLCISGDFATRKEREENGKILSLSSKGDRRNGFENNEESKNRVVSETLAIEERPAPDVSIQMQPLKMPPTSKPQFKVIKEQEIAKTKISRNHKFELEGDLREPTIKHQSQCAQQVYKHNAHQESVRKCSNHFLDVEMDATSAAAAVKKAMEQAQDRLNSAKEFMERKHSLFQSSRKIRCHVEKKENRVIGKVKCGKEDMTQITAVNAQEPRKSIIAPSDDEKETSMVDSKISQGKETLLFQSSEINGKQELKRFREKSKSKTREEEENDCNVTEECKRVKEIFDQECFANKSKVILKDPGETENESKAAEMTDEKNMSFFVINESGGCVFDAREHATSVVIDSREEFKKMLDASAGVCMPEEHNNTLDVSPEVHVQERNKVKREKSLDIYLQEETDETFRLSDELHVCAAEQNSNAAQGSFTGKEKVWTSEASEKSCKLEEFYLRKEEEKTPFAGKKDGECIDNLNATFAQLEFDENEKMLLSNKSGKQDESNREFEVSNESCLYEVRENIKEAQETCAFEESEKIEELSNSYFSDLNDYKVKKTTDVRLEQEELKESKEIEGTSCQLKVEKKKGLKLAEGALGDTKNENSVEDSNEVCQLDCIEKWTRVTELLRQHSEKKLNARNEQEDSEHMLTEGCQDTDYAETTGASFCTKKDNKEVNLSQAVGEGFEKCCSESVATLLEKKRNEPTVNATEVCFTTSAAKTTSHSQKEDEIGNKGRTDKDSEKEKELMRKLEEEKEREREREKDRLAVERVTNQARERAIPEPGKRAERSKLLDETVKKHGRVKTECASVARGTSEAWEQDALGVKGCTEKSTFSYSSMARKDGEAEGFFRTNDKENSKIMLNPNGMPDASKDRQSHTSFQRYSGPPNHGPRFDGNSALRCKARLERHQQIVERAAKALAEKNMRDILSQREQAEKNRLAESLDTDVRRWANGKEGNLRALLSTLQYILGPEVGWEPISLTEVITATAIKKAYRKATLCVHPDKLQQRGANVQQKYICEKVFYLLQDAWNKFNSEQR